MGTQQGRLRPARELHEYDPLVPEQRGLAELGHLGHRHARAPAATRSAAAAERRRADIVERIAGLPVMAIAVRTTRPRASPGDTTLARRAIPVRPAGPRAPPAATN